MRRRIAFFGLLAALSLGVYLAASGLTSHLGFPLDDAWIHQTYARSLGLHGEWAYLPGQPSAGSTAPLWSALLAIGQRLHLGPFLWTYLLGWILLCAIALAGSLALHKLSPLAGSRTGISQGAFFGGVFLLFEWHLVWAAGSGMETLLFALFVLLALVWVLPEPGDQETKLSWYYLGLWIGLSVWVRPEGITLLGPAGLVLLFSQKPWLEKAKAGLRLGVGAALLIAPYLIFNRWLSGAWWPNTFFAKQAEYAALQQTPLWIRLGWEASLPLVGAGALLLPGFIWFMVQSARRRLWGAIAGAFWLLGYLGLYAWRLPVTYQHGRYIIPAMPVFFIWGLAGFAHILSQTRWKVVPWRRVLQKAWLASTAALLILFWFLGAQAYARDVAVIETEMVATAQWIDTHTPSEALIAAHDIGALGYFGHRHLVDLAGLLSPEVIPFLRNETYLAGYMDAQHVDYLVTFPAWYPFLVQQGELIYITGAPYSPGIGGENMAVYRWRFR